jgi:hypothetical protein
MGLDVYVGSLTRYYSGEWETILQPSAVVVRPPEPTFVHPATPNSADIATNRPETLLKLREIAEKLGGQVVLPGDRATLSDSERRRLQKEVATWRKRISKQLRGYIQGEIEWDESPGAPYFTDKPGWESYVALALWAAYDDHPGLPRPITVVEDWTTDPAWKASAAEGFRTQYEHVIQGPEIWLPVEFQSTLKTKDVRGKRITVGSSQSLLRELNLLNERTWRADATALKQWRFDGPGPRDSLEPNARFGLALFLDLCEKSVAHRLPMKLDY